MTRTGLRTDNRALGERGVSLIAAVFIIVVLAFLGVMFVTLINTSSLTSVNEMQSAQALSVAEGGVEYEQRILARNVDWYRSPDPVDASTQNLGPGSFTATSTIPATMLQRRLRQTDTTATVYSTARFPTSGFLQIEDSIGGGAEFVQYTGITGNTFTGLTRGRTIGSVSSVAGNHPRGSNVYPVAQLANNLPNNCNPPASISITVPSTAANQVKFLSAGTLDFQGEEIMYTGYTTSGANTLILTGIQRCQGPTPSAAYSANDPVTPVLDGGVTASNQAEIVATGSVGAAVRTVKKTVQR